MASIVHIGKTDKDKKRKIYKEPRKKYDHSPHEVKHAAYRYKESIETLFTRTYDKGLLKTDHSFIVTNKLE